MSKEEGYFYGLEPARQFCDLCLALGIAEVTAFGFTADNTKRPPQQRVAFQKACVQVADAMLSRDVSLLVVGNSESPMFPPELKSYTTRESTPPGKLRANLLVNYDWLWDVRQAARAPDEREPSRSSYMKALGSASVSRIDLIIRWGGRRRLSGLLPIQSVYADFFIVEEFWPDFNPEHLFSALRWYQEQDITLGG